MLEPLGGGDQIPLSVVRVPHLFLFAGTFPVLALKVLRPGNPLNSTISKPEN